MLNNVESTEFMEEINDIGHIAENTYDLVVFLRANNAPQEMIDVAVRLHNYVHIPLSSDIPWEETYKFVLGWKKNDV